MFVQDRYKNQEKEYHGLYSAFVLHKSKPSGNTRALARMVNEDDAWKAMNELHNTKLMGKTLMVRKVQHIYNFYGRLRRIVAF